MKLIFEWDINKDKLNLKKHKVGFEESKEVFLDDFAVTFRDVRYSKDEERFIIIGLSSKQRMLLVVHTERNSLGNSVIIRIISCRKATKAERRIYEKGE